jgi:signal transduction histidine kinase
MDAVLYLIDVAPQEAKNNLRELLNVMCKGLNEVRNHIHRIASDDQERSLTLALSQIAREFSIHTDTKICLDTQGSERAVSENVRLTFIRCLQESLTNAKKHGMASHIRLVLVYTEESITLSIADDGKGTGKLAEGFGLRAMGERVANVYGRLDIVSRESGTIIRCTIPTKSVVGTE